MVLFLVIITLVMLTSYAKENNTNTVNNDTNISIDKKENKTHITEITVYYLTPFNSSINKSSVEIDNITLFKNETLFLAINLFMNNNSQAFRHISYELLDSNGNIIAAGRGRTKLQAEFYQYHDRNPVSYMNLRIKDLEVGDYTMKFIYGGNHRQGWPVAIKNVKLHVIPAPITTNSSSEIPSP